MATIKVSNQTQLLSALKTATGGDTILLADGNYGAVSMSSKFASAVTIQAEHPQGAVFTSLSVKSAANLSFDGLKFETNFAAQYSKGISLTNSETTSGMVYFREVNGLVVDKVTATGGQYSILLNSIQNFSVTNSTFGKATEDVMRITGDSHHGVIENNTLADTIATYPTHPDMLQFFGANGYTPHDITLRGNLFYDDPSTGGVSAQGIFLAGPQGEGYKNILIEDNLINVSSPNSIYIHGGTENVMVRGNTLIPNANDGGAIIRLVGATSGYSNAGTTIQDNIAKLVVDETKDATFTHNYFYGRGADLASLFSGSDGSHWQSYVPKAGSVIDFGSGYGALDRLKELLLQHSVVDKQAPEASSDSDTPVYHLDASYELTGTKAGVVKLADDKSMDIDTGSIGVTFNADTVSGSRGILSKGAAGYDDDFSVWIKDGKLILCAENDLGQTVTLTKTGIKANTDYDVLITFDEQKVKLWLNGTQVGEANFDLDLSGNSEYLVLGGINGQSTRGTTDRVSGYFDGTISHLSIYDSVLTPTEFSTLETLRHEHDLATSLTY